MHTCTMVCNAYFRVCYSYQNQYAQCKPLKHANFGVHFLTVYIAIYTKVASYVYMYITM